MQQKPPVRFNHREQMAIFLYVLLQTAKGHMAAILPFIRHSFGPKFFEPASLVAIILLQPLAAASRGGKVYFWVWLAAMAGQRIQTFRLWLTNNRLYSSYPGEPFAALQMPFVKSVDDAAATEPLICLFAGLFLVTISEPVGFFVMGGFISFNVHRAIVWWAQQQQRQSMVDAEYEMHVQAEQYRR